MESDSFQIDQEFQEHMHRLKPDEETQLEANLLRDGCRDALVVWEEEGLLLDGHNRAQLCQQHSIPYEVKTVSLPDRQAALMWILETQLGRRNSSRFEKAELALKLKPVIAAKAKENERIRKGKQAGASLQNSANLSPVDTRDELATKAGVSHDTIAKVEYIAKAGDEAIKEKLRRGESSIDKEYRELKKEQGRLQRQQLKQTPVDIPDDDRVSCFACDIANAKCRIEAESVDWIITDPPYPKKYLHVYGQLGEFAAHALKPGGSLLAMVGQSYLPEIVAQLANNLNYHWTLAYLTPGGQAVQVWDRKANTFWKPILWFTKGKYAGDWVGDVCRSQANDNDKQHHRWGQSVSGMSDLLKRFVYPGQTVCDPFSGAGTTGIAAIEAGCRFVALDVDTDCIEKTRARVGAALKEVSRS